MTDISSPVSDGEDIEKLRAAIRDAWSELETAHIDAADSEPKTAKRWIDCARKLWKRVDAMRDALASEHRLRLAAQQMYGDANRALRDQGEEREKAIGIAKAALVDGSCDVQFATTGEWMAALWRSRNLWKDACAAAEERAASAEQAADIVRQSNVEALKAVDAAEQERDRAQRSVIAGLQEISRLGKALDTVVDTAHAAVKTAEQRAASAEGELAEAWTHLRVHCNGNCGRCNPMAISSDPSSA